MDTLRNRAVAFGAAAAPAGLTGKLIRAGLQEAAPLPRHGRSSPAAVARKGGEPLPHLLVDFRAEREPLSLRLSVPSERYEDQDPAARPTRQGQVSSMELSAAFSFAVTESP